MGETNPWIEQYIRWGISIFPLKEKDKKPALSWEEYQHRHPTPEEIQSWLSDGHRNWGAVCGSVSDNLVVIDVDKEELFKELDLERFAKETFTVRTGKGYHIYLRVDSPIRRKSLTWDGKEELRFQAEGSYVVACGSIHPTGKEYSHYEVSPIEIKKYPVSILEDIENAWKRYHNLDKIEEKRKIVKESTTRGRDLEEFKKKVGMKLIEKYVEPKRRYSNYWQGLCPFHDDHDPSFTVYEDTNSWYCFGCQKYGDIINFIQEIEHLDFISAIKKIEEETGVEFFKREKDEETGEERRKISHATLAEIILNIYNFITLKDTEEVLWWDGKKWSFGGEVKIKELCQRIVRELGKMEKATNHLVNETIGFIQRETYIDRYVLNMHKRKIPLLNGVYDLETDQLLPPSPEYYFTYCLPVEYDPKADCPRIKKFLSEILDPEDIPVLLEFIGYTLIPEQEFHKALMLVGDGANGKSTLIKLIKTFLGKHNTTSISLQSLLENRFAVADLYGKLANLYADLPDETLRHTGIFKMIAGGDTISAERKFKPFFEFEPTCKLIFSANKVPKTLDDTSAFFRRWIILNFPNKFEGDRKDPYILKKITTREELSGFFNLVLVHLKKLLERGDFSMSKSTEEVREDYIRKSDPVQAFILDYMSNGWIIESSQGYVTKDELYAEFVKYCKKIKLPAPDKSVFGRNLKRVMPTITEVRKKIGGENKRCWGGIVLVPPEEEEKPERKEEVITTIEEFVKEEEEMKSVKILILKDIPTFVYIDQEGNLKNISLKKNDIVSLPKKFAQILIDKKVAEAID